jgi:monoamine oxidase
MATSAQRTKKQTLEHFDLVCIGAGISGLYTAYKWCKKNPTKRNVLILERSGRIGGRVQTITKQHMTYEAGAGRFHSQHRKFWKLLRELDLDSRALPLPKHEHYFIDGKYMKTDKEIEEHYGLTRSVADIWRHIYQTRTDKAMSMSLLEYINSIGLSDNEIDAIITTFGYKSEFTILNASHAIDILGHDFNIDNRTEEESFYVLKGGLTQIVDALHDRLIEYGVTFRMRTECWRVDYKDTECCVYMNQYPTEMRCITPYCIVACPSRAFSDIRFYSYESTGKPTRITIPRDKMPEPYALYRMYAAYPKDQKTGKVWFDGIPKVVTDIPISMIIPINYDSGLIMISYSDNGDADYWNRFGTPEEIQTELKRQLSIVFPDIEIPEAKWTTYHFWQEGCHGWTRANHGKAQWDRLLSQFVKKMGSRVSWINEASSYHQGWMEGSLELVDDWMKTHRPVNIGGGSLKQYTMKDVSKHDKITDAWTAIVGNVYDITKWIPQHPGGAIAIMQIAGKDGTKLFMGNPIHESKGAMKILKKYWIGKLI